MRKHREERIKEALDLPEPEGRPCDAPGCRGHGDHRAPVSRSRLNEFYWFCRDHAREYNQAWDYYKDMSPGEIEWHIQQDLQWRRPLWPLGGRFGQKNGARLSDMFDLFDESGETEGGRDRHCNGGRRRHQPESPEQKALAILDLDAPATLAHIKARYKELVKRLHPDANGGDKAAEERLKLVNQAYAILKSSALVR